jgi:2-polyprenyl-3-methyl-5-hydroxy-6-metoxy-1,4-benzoquinol methylase
MESNNIEQVFTDIYKNNTWSSLESASGTGSEIIATTEVRERLPELIQNYEIKNVLDIGCGDFNWMKTIIHHIGYYVGVDTVSEIINENNRLYGTDNIVFLHKNILDLDWEFYSAFDAVILKDVLVHLSFKNITKILTQLKLSRVKYLLATSFLGCQINKDIPDGSWRVINLLASPFNLPRPLETVISYSDFYRVGEELHIDKTLTMWSIGLAMTEKHNRFVDPYVKRELKQIMPKHVVDVGPGDGYWGKVSRLMFPDSRITGIELSEKWFNHCSGLEVYDFMALEDIYTAIRGTSGDVIIFGDVLEHLEKDRAVETLKEAVARFKYIIINAPVGFVPQEHEDIEEIHRCGLTREDFSAYKVLEYREGTELETEYVVFNCLIKGNGR